MMILGLDLGTNSIGWSLIDDTNNKIKGSGVRIFQGGVQDLGKGEKEISKNASRREARGARRQTFRRKLRKIFLLKKLMQYGFCPFLSEDLDSWVKNKSFPKKEYITQWLSLNPYELRHKALVEPLELHELGRIFYHMIQRRGFLSNSRSATKEEGVIFKGDPKGGKIGINTTREEISDTTLGDFLYSLQPTENSSYAGEKERIRNRYTTRSMYAEEFDRIWQTQAALNPHLSDKMRIDIGGRKKNGDPKDGALFHQRPLRSQKFLIGKCSLEPKKPRCTISALSFEYFKIYQFANTIECNGQRLSQEDRDKIVEKLLRKEKPKFIELRKAIEKIDPFYKFNYQDSDKAPGSSTISALASAKFFGKEWFSFDEKIQEDIWHILYSFDDQDKLTEYAKAKWGFDEKKSEAISKFHLKDGYSNLSKKAISNILPFLIDGHQYDKAVVLGGVKNAFGEKWNNLTLNQVELITTNIPEIINQKKTGGFITDLKTFLASEFHLNEKELGKLYHHSTDINDAEPLLRLPTGKEADREIQSVRNPIVIQALFELRKVVNAIIDECGKPDRINVELARDLKVSKSARQRIRVQQNQNEDKNEAAKKILRDNSQHISHENILKVKLWEECQKQCPFTGRSIGVSELFSGEVQIEHILPYSKSLDDSYINKTLCFADENRAKGNRTPFEFYSNQGSDKWEEVKNRALTLFYDTREFPTRYKKFKRFIQKDLDEGFIQRQLNDTRYISRTAKDYLSKICPRVDVFPGQLTAKLRHLWGLNSIINHDSDQKTREDHRHHAIDALVLAVTKTAFLQEMTKWNRYHDRVNQKKFPEPWEGFLQDATRSINDILVSFRTDRKVLSTRYYKTKKDGQVYRNKGISARGQLHKENVYGNRKKDDLKAFHIRKPLESLDKKSQLEKIVDPQIKKLIFEHIEAIGGFEGKENVPKGAFFEGNSPRVFLPNKKGEKVPIRKVRIRENLGNAVPLKEDDEQWVNPKNNHHILIYRTHDGELAEDVVTFWTAAERQAQGQPIFQLPSDGVEIIETLQENDLFVLGFTSDEVHRVSSTILSEYLYRVQKISSSYYTFRHHLASSIQNKEQESSIRSFKSWMKLNPIKLFLSPAGVILENHA